MEITIDNKVVTVDENKTILEVCKDLGIYIPTLCYHPDQEIKGKCRLCVVEIEGSKKLQTSCSTKVRDGMVINTNSEKVAAERDVLVKLLLSNHDYDCDNCKRDGNCELQTIVKKLNIDTDDINYILEKKEIDNSSPSLIRNPNKCVSCGRCIEACDQEIELLKPMQRGNDSYVGIPNTYLNNSACTFCGQCSLVCPVAAIMEKDDIDKVMDAIESDKHVIVQIAPAIRVSIGNTTKISTKKIVSALKKIGFDKVFDTNFGADLTIVEESHELYNRVKNNGTLPMITSCCPGWMNFVTDFFPDQLANISTCKSPQQMFGAIAKSYYVEKMNMDPKDIFVVSIMPCTAKKHEITKNNDTDIVLTTREFERMIKDIDFDSLEETDFDNPFGIASGAGAIFGNTGGVLEAALRTFYELSTKELLPEINFMDIRGMAGIKEATINIKGKEIKVAVAHTLKNARKILEEIKEGASEYTFIEVMACPGGCIGGGGQPYTTNNKTREERIKAIYEIDESSIQRKSHENPDLITLYETYLGRPNGPKAHKLLHMDHKKKTN